MECLKKITKPPPKTAKSVESYSYNSMSPNLQKVQKVLNHSPTTLCVFLSPLLRPTLQ